jgi:uncharacterized membrane protein
MKKIIILIAIIFNTQLMAQEFSCFGTEPFWGLKVTSQKIEFNNLTDEIESSNVISITNALGTVDLFATVLKTDNQSSLTIVQGECNDGMSDNIYSHHAVFNTHNSVFYGCCEIK